MGIEIELRKPVPPGTRRQLTPTEIGQIREKTSLRAYQGPQWQICRDDDGNLSLLSVRQDCGITSWAVDEAVQNTKQVTKRMRP